jgi:hypothetical protein
MEVATDRLVVLEVVVPKVHASFVTWDVLVILARGLKAIYCEFQRYCSFASAAG